MSLGYNPATLVSIGAAVYAVVAFARIFLAPGFTASQRRRVARYVPFFLATLMFALLYQQLYTTIAVYSEKSTNRMIWGVELPPATILGLAPLCTIALAPALAAVWGRLGQRQPTLAVKFAAAFLICGVSLVTLAIAAGTGSLTPLWVLALIAFVFGAADTVLSPSGISLATNVAPPGYESRMLALHYVGASIGTALAGVIAENFAPGAGASGFFATLSIVAFAVAAAMSVVRFVVGRRLVA